MPRATRSRPLVAERDLPTLDRDVPDVGDRQVVASQLDRGRHAASLDWFRAPAPSGSTLLGPTPADRVDVTSARDRPSPRTPGTGERGSLESRYRRSRHRCVPPSCRDRHRRPRPRCLASARDVPPEHAIRLEAREPKRRGSRRQRRRAVGQARVVRRARRRPSHGPPRRRFPPGPGRRARPPPRARHAPLPPRRCARRARAARSRRDRRRSSRPGSARPPSRSPSAWTPGSPPAGLPHRGGDLARDLERPLELQVVRQERRARADEHRAEGRIQASGPVCGHELSGVDTLLQLRPARPAGRTPAADPPPASRRGTPSPRAPPRAGARRHARPTPRAACPPARAGRAERRRRRPRAGALRRGAPRSIAPRASAMPVTRPFSSAASSPRSVNTDRWWSASTWVSSRRAPALANARPSAATTPASRPSDTFGTDSSGSIRLL